MLEGDTGNDRNGYKAVVQVNNSLMSASGGKADVRAVQVVNALCNQRREQKGVLYGEISR